MIRLIEAGPEQLDEIEAVETESFTCPWSRNSIREALESERIRVTAALDESGILCGFGCLLILDDEAEVLNLAVSQPFRRQGIGAALLASLIREAENRGVLSLYLEVRQSNLPARSLYEKNGFEILGIRKKYYSRPTEDAVIMVRRTPEQENPDKGLPSC